MLSPMQTCFSENIAKVYLKCQQANFYGASVKVPVLAFMFPK
jgi:hypothetical protein